MLTSDKSISEKLDKLNALMSVLVKLKLAQTSDGMNQKDLIVSLDSLGVDTPTIAELLNTSIGTVRVTLSRNRKRRTKDNE